jgi:hypothetical protein
MSIGRFVMRLNPENAESTAENDDMMVPQFHPAA